MTYAVRSGCNCGLCCNWAGEFKILGFEVRICLIRHGGCTVHFACMMSLDYFLS